MFADIQNLFVNEHGSYAKRLQLQTLFVIVLVIGFFTLSFRNNYGFVIILLVFAVYMANTYVSITNNATDDFNKMTMFRLQTLQSKVKTYIDTKLKLINNSNPIRLSASEIEKIYLDNTLDALYINANVVHFLYSIVALYDYNAHEFYKLLKGTNNLLRIQRDIERFYEANGEYPENTSELFQIALDLRSNIINNLHNFIYTVPKMTIMYDYLNSSIDRYAVLMSRITDTIHMYYLANIKRRGINTTTQFVTYDTTKPHDPQNVNNFYT